MAYGFKDLRIENSTGASICFRLTLGTARLSCSVCSPAPILPCEVEFAATRRENGLTLVETRRRKPGASEFDVVDLSQYRRLLSA